MMEIKKVRGEKVWERERVSDEERERERGEKDGERMERTR